MFVLMWAALLFSVRGNNADTGTSVSENPYCHEGYCVTLNERQLRAEAGLCVVIPCLFKTAAPFKPQHIVWYKWEASEPTSSNPMELFWGHNVNPLIIFHTNNSIKVPFGFEGRVSLLEPDVSQNNCSIIINDLKQSDSGSYRLRVNGELNGKQDGFTFIPKVTVSVTGLKKMPKVKIPTLTEGQQATLTCIAPGLCSGSVPEITWTWRGAGETESHFTGNITSFKTKNLTAFTQRHISALTFDPSAEYHNTNVTCKISFMGETATEGSSTLIVTYVKKVKISGVTSVKEGETLKLNCSVESFPPALVMWTKLGSDINLHSDTGSASLFIQNVTAEHSGQYVCTAKYMNNTLEEKVSLTVIYMKEVKITGATRVREGEGLNLTCSVESFPPALIVWRKQSCNTNLHSDTGSATLIIQNVAAEHSGQYVCTAKHLDTSVITYVDVIVTRTLSLNGAVFLPIAVVSILVNVIFIICLAFLWNSRKKIKPEDKDSTYMSLQKTDRSPEYDVICQPPKEQVSQSEDDI